MIRDTQRSAVYRFDWKIQLYLHDKQSEMPIQECRDLILKAWLLLPPEYDDLPELLDGEEGAVAWGNARYIKLPKWCRKRSDVLHEIAHSMICQMYNPKKVKVAAHGAEFMTIFMWLLHVFCDVPYATMYRYCAELNIEHVVPEERLLA